MMKGKDITYGTEFFRAVVWVYFILSQEELVRLALSLMVFKRRVGMKSLSNC